MQKLLVLSLSCVLLGCVDGGEGADDDPDRTRTGELPPIEARRSLAVTEVTLLDGFGLERVLDQLVAQSGVPGLTSVQLFQQWWDIMNPRPGLGLGPHCDDAVDATLGPVLNGFPYACRPSPAEGAQATCDPFAPESPCAYVPIALVNRFDLAPENGDHCGEYRIVYAKRSGILTSTDRVLLIFEAIMPNPQRFRGLEGCREIARFWADLGGVADLATRADLLETFYFDGLPSEGVTTLPPVIHIEHLGANHDGYGQIRTNQFSNATPWTLREFKLDHECGPPHRCTALRVVPVPNQQNPFGPLFASASTHPMAAEFQDRLVKQVRHIDAGELSDIDVGLSGKFDSGQSLASSTFLETSYATHFGDGPSAFRSALEAELARRAIPLTADDIVRRVQALSCAGCHRLSNAAPLGRGLTWPSSLGFTHVSERTIEEVDGVGRYPISPAMESAFLPHRKQVLEDYLAGRLVPRGIPKRPIGGFAVH
jgi:hypothetical protein